MQILLPNPTLLAVCAWLEKVLLHFNYTHDDEAKYTVYSDKIVVSDPWL